MFDVQKISLDWGGRPLTLETGRMARQADGAVLVKYGETTVLATAVGVKEVAAGQDFFPLSVHYQEKMYSAGRIPGGFLKREGRPSEAEVLNSRLIDRPIRPLFPSAFKNEVQVVCTLMSFDGTADPAIAAMIGASAALSISGMPFMGPIAGARVGLIDGDYVLNPSHEALKNSKLDLVVAGTTEGVLMVESEAKRLSEEEMLKAVTFGHEAFQPVIKAINELKEKAGKPAWDVPEVPAHLKALTADVAEKALPGLEAAYAERVKQERRAKIQAAKASVMESYADQEDISEAEVAGVLDKVEKDMVRQNLLKTGVRIDGRDTKTVRPITCEVGVLPRTHGSALFTRGETQALVVTTLGTADDEQIMDVLSGEYRERFLLHYNFPPFSVGEAGRLGSPGRREVGHGKLAWRALNPEMPSKENFPYTIRVVSEVLESNGSSSMATVCGGSLSMMDAGVPLEHGVAGIAMGLIKEDDAFVVLSDILGDEDHLGDMDFKVAGTKDGITALQMDIKITSIDENIMRTALEQARDGRLHILGEMEKALTTSRGAISDYAPKMLTMKIAVDKIRDVIGSGGKVIRELCEITQTKISIEDDGSITIAGVGNDALEDAKKRIENIVAVPEEGKIYRGKVAKVVDFGAFVDFLGTSGLVHVSELEDYRVENVSDVVKVGDEFDVKVLAIDSRGKVRLSKKAAAKQDA